MSIVTSRPIKSGCVFNAVGNMLVYTLQRKDYQFTQINNNAGAAQVQINTIDLTAFFETGDLVYVGALGYNGVFRVIAQVFSGGNTLVTLNGPFVGTGTGYINNISKRTDYKIEVEVFESGTNVSLGPRIVSSPGADGSIKVDISGIVKTFLSAEWNEPTVNEEDSEVFKKVYIKYQDFYDATYFELFSDSATPITAVFGAIPLLLNPPPDFTRYAHGGNLLSFLPEDDESKWLTRFDRVSYWRDWPFSISFLWPEISDIDLRIIQKDNSGNEISDTNDALTPTTNNTVHRVELGDIDPDTKTILISLEDVTGSGSEQITEELTLVVKDPCKNPVLLFWKNSLGGDAFWLFEFRQEYTYTYDNDKKAQRLTLFADDLTFKEWNAINELNNNSLIITKNITDFGMDDSIDKTHFRNDNQVYIINQDGSKTGVIVIPTSNKTKTDQYKHVLDITIELPEVLTV